jgi:hypothetical protein
MTTPDDLVERVAKELAMNCRCAMACDWRDHRGDARVAIAIALEEAAKKLEGWGDIYGRNAAAAIRAMIPNGNEPAQDDTGNAR